MKPRKNVFKIISAILLVLILLSIGMQVYAADITPSKVTEHAKSDNAISTKVFSVSGQILRVVQAVATAIAIIMLIVLAIKYMTASPDGKADIKTTAYIYVVGAFILFGAASILGLIQTFTNNALK